jgi:hypothetical protein
MLPRRLPQTEAGRSVSTLNSECLASARALAANAREPGKNFPS